MTIKYKYLIWSFEHKSWWKPNCCGYTLDKSLAGRYSKEEAEKIVKDANIVETNEEMIEDATTKIT